MASTAFDCSTWFQFLDIQWPLHVRAAWSTVKRTDMMHLRQLLRDFVVHGRHHALHEILIVVL